MSDSSIVRQIDNSPAAWESQVDLIKRTVAAGCSNDELALFFHQAKRAGLDPLAKQIYAIKRQGKMTIQTGIDGFRLIADRTGLYAGNDDPVFSGQEGPYPALATVTVHKLVGGVRCPFTATARWLEYFPGDQQGFQWKRMPHAMLGKCAEALALRKAFPADLSGLYEHSEMEQAGAATSVPQAVPVSASFDEKVRNAGLYFRRTIKGNAEQYAEFKGACEENQWPEVALDAEQRGIVTFDGLMRFALEGVVPEDVEAIHAEFTESSEPTGA